MNIELFKSKTYYHYKETTSKPTSISRGPRIKGDGN